MTYQIVIAPRNSKYLKNAKNVHEKYSIGSSSFSGASTEFILELLKSESSETNIQFHTRKNRNND